jgi:hypothetical protein
MSSCGHHKQTVAFVLNRNTDGSEVFRERTALLREFLAGLTKPGDETVTLFADGRAVEISGFLFRSAPSFSHSVSPVENEAFPGPTYYAALLRETRH